MEKSSNVFRARNQSMKTRTKLTAPTIILAIIVGMVLSACLQAKPHRVRLHQLVENEIRDSDLAAEIEFGKEVAARILGNESRNKNPELTRYINLIGKTLTLHIARNEIQYYFTLIEDDYPNAFSAPGGYVFITTGALKLAEDESEVAAILAHEIAHITSRHIINELDIKGSDDSNISGFTRVLSIFSDMTRVALNQAADKALDILFRQGYKLKEEYQADNIAMQILAETGYDPEALHRYLKRVEKQNIHKKKSGPVTHPSPDIRLSRIVATIHSNEFDALNFPRMQRRYRQNIQQHH